MKSSDRRLLDDYLADFVDHPIATVHRPDFVDGHHLAVIGVDCLTVDIMCDRCGRQQCPGCGSSVVVDLDAGTHPLRALSVVRSQFATVLKRA